jgi:hypothetical protein
MVCSIPSFSYFDSGAASTPHWQIYILYIAAIDACGFAGLSEGHCMMLHKVCKFREYISALFKG